MPSVNINIPVTFQTIEQVDERFMKVKIWLMHLGENYNGSFFDRSVVTNALETLANTPILGYIEDNSNGEDDFSDHRMIVVKEQDGIKIKYVGQAYGVIPTDNNAKFEERIGDDGMVRTYVTCEGLLWRKWDDSIAIMDRDNTKAQSMELSPNYEGFWGQDGLFHFTSFKFFGACILGDVKPAMNSATIEKMFSYSEVHGEIQAMMEQFKAVEKQSKEVNGMEQEFQTEEVVNESTEETFEEVVNTEEVNETVEEFTAEETNEEAVEEEFTSEEESASDLPNEEEQPTEEVVEEVTEAPADEAPANEAPVSDFEAEKTAFTTRIEELENQLVTVTQERDSLKAFKANFEKEQHIVQVNELFEKFDKLTEEDVADLKAEVMNYSIEALEEKLFSRLGKKLATFSTKETKKATIKIDLDIKSGNETSGKSYDHLFQKYTN